MSRTALNAIVDAVAYAGLVVLATTGLMLRWQMPPGSGGLHGMGSGAGAGSRPVTVVWGLSRHEWGSVHYWIALVLMGVLAVHLVTSLEMDRMRPSRQTSLRCFRWTFRTGCRRTCFSHLAGSSASLNASSDGPPLRTSQESERRPAD